MISELLPLREQRACVLDYFHRMDFQFSDVLESIMRYAFNSADPLCASLVLWACEACGGDPQTILPVAASIECFHRFAVLHDELQMQPALSVERKTASSIWGLAQTLNAGDAFHALALRMLAADATHPDRVLKVGVMLTRTVLHGIEQRSRIAAGNAGDGSRGRLRAAFGGTEPLMLGSSLRAGALMADAPPPTADALYRAGGRLGVAVQFAQHQGSRALAERYAVKAVSGVEGSSLKDAYVREFKEIAHYLTTGS